MIKKVFSIILLVILIFYLYLIFKSPENFNNDFQNQNYSWSSYWTPLDFKARENADCNPIKKEYKQLGNIKSWIWTVPRSCEDGLPHTRDNNIIAIPDGFSHEKLPSTIEHEKIHLYQRLYPKEWMVFYNNHWNYEIFSMIPQNLPKELITYRRANPDTISAPWCCWNKRWWSVPIYDESLRLTNSNVKWYDSQTKQTFDKPPKEWLDFFGDDIYQVEHPHEISAVYLSNEKYLKKDIPALNILKKLFSQQNSYFPKLM